MSLQKAIEILKDARKCALSARTWGFDFERGFTCAIEVLEREKKGWIWPSRDTQYKKDLTAWIERKKRLDAMERYTFESGSFKGVPWMNCKIDIDHEEGEG